MKIQKIFGSLIILIWIIVSAVIGSGGFLITDAIDKVQQLEYRIDKEIKASIIENYEKADNIIRQLAGEGIKLEAVDKEAIRNLEHVMWYFRYEGYSYVIFLTIMPFLGLLILTGGALGTFGGTIKVIYDHNMTNKTVGTSNFFWGPGLGFLMGVAVFLFSYYIIAPVTGLMPIIVLCLFAGLYAKKFYDWMNKTIPINPLHQN